MSELSFVRRCHNCGAILQSDDKQAPGYVEPEVLGNIHARVLFCNKCFDETRYNFSPKSPKVDQDIATMLQDAQAADAMIVYVVDLFSFENSFIPEIVEIIHDLPLLVIANKRDLMPECTNDEELREYVAHRFRVARLACKAEDVILTSLNSDSDVSGIWGLINERRRAHDVYVIGARYSGKTQLISSLLHNYVNPTGQSVSTITYPGTSLQVMQIPLDHSSCLYDSPGTSLSNSILAHVEGKSLTCVLPKKAVEGKKITLSKGESLFIGGVARIELAEGEKTSLEFYAAPRVETHKTSSKEAAELFIKKSAKESYLPIASKPVEDADFDAYDLVITETTRRDLGIAGLCWFNFQGAGQRFRIYILKGVGIYGSRPKVHKHDDKARP